MAVVCVASCLLVHCMLRDSGLQGYGHALHPFSAAYMLVQTLKCAGGTSVASCIASFSFGFRRIGSNLEWVGSTCLLSNVAIHDMTPPTVLVATTRVVQSPP